MYNFIQNVRIDRIGLFVAFCFLSGVPNFAHCQSSTNYTIRTQVLNCGGGTCGSDHHRLIFSVGPAMGNGTSQDSRRNLSPGFIASVAGLREAADGSESADGSGTDGGSSSGGQCFIGILF